VWYFATCYQLKAHWIKSRSLYPSLTISMVDTELGPWAGCWARNKKRLAACLGTGSMDLSVDNVWAKCKRTVMVIWKTLPVPNMEDKSFNAFAATHWAITHRKWIRKTASIYSYTIKIRSAVSKTKTFGWAKRRRPFMDFRESTDFNSFHNLGTCVQLYSFIKIQILKILHEHVAGL
jgi:hypothetical protein